MGSGAIAQREMNVSRDDTDVLTHTRHILCQKRIVGIGRRARLRFLKLYAEQLGHSFSRTKAMGKANLDLPPIIQRTKRVSYSSASEQPIIVLRMHFQTDPQALLNLPSFELKLMYPMTWHSLRSYATLRMQTVSLKLDPPIVPCPARHDHISVCVLPTRLIISLVLELLFT